MISWQKFELRRFSGGFVSVMTKTLPCRSTLRFLDVRMLSIAILHRENGFRVNNARWSLLSIESQKSLITMLTAITNSKVPTKCKTCSLPGAVCSWLDKDMVRGAECGDVNCRSRQNFPENCRYNNAGAITTCESNGGFGKCQTSPQISLSNSGVQH